MNTGTIRPATRGDLKGVLALYRYLNPDDPPSEVKRTEEVWEAIRTSGLTTILVAELDGILVSSCMLVIVPNMTRGLRPYGLIENVVTHPHHRRRGIGRSVLEAALKSAWDRKCYKVMLATGSRKPETLRFYESAGLERSGKTFFEARRL